MEEFQVVDNCLMVKLPEEVDHYRTSYICERADHFILNGKVDHVAFDFGTTKFMDSSGIGLVMGRYKLMKTVHGRIRVENLSPSAYKVMVLAGLERLGEIKQKEVV